jgi:hypothetical protein
MQHRAEPWTDEDITLLSQMYWMMESKWSVDAGGFVDLPKFTRSQLAEYFGRSLSAIDTQISRYSIAREKSSLPTGAKMRKCMPCQRMFFSTDRGNRFCRRCKEKERAGILECA